jgi:hypothetical protein
MKKLRKFKLLIVCIITILFSSCNSTKYSFVVDENNPLDKNATILFQYYNYMDEYHTFKKWNDINIEKHLPRYGGILIVPAGNSLITFDVFYNYRKTDNKEIYSRMLNYSMILNQEKNIMLKVK